MARAVLVAAVLGGLLAGCSSGRAKASKETEPDTTATSESSATTTASKLPVTPPAAPAGRTLTGDTPCPAADGSSERTRSFAKEPPTCIDPAKAYVAEMATNKGPITIALDAKAAPRTVNSFVVLARYHYFDGVSFHRIIPGFVIQGGDPQATGRGGPGYKFADELPQPGLYKVGSLAMANSGPNTNGSQFFIITGPQGVGLPPNYALFGQVTAGLETVKAIEAVGTSSGGPTEVVTIQSLIVKES